MSLAVVIVIALVVIATQAITCWTLRQALEKAQAENKRLVAIVTAPTPNAAHAAALDRPHRPPRDDPPTTLRPIG